MRKFFVFIIIGLIFNFATVVYAEEVSPYFSWEIKNFDDYAKSSFAVYGIDVDQIKIRDLAEAKNKITAYDMYIGDIKDTRDRLYGKILRGEYSDAVKICEMITAYQKIIFGTYFFDESLIELTAKLYLTIDQLDIAEQKINFLSDNANDHLTRIRALNLKSNLMNRRGNWREALKLTEEVDKLLQNTPDENLNLINQSRMARAYCGLNENQKSLEIAEKIFPSIQETFGESDIETLEIMSTIAENYFKTQRDLEAQKILLSKGQIIIKNSKTNLILLSKSVIELANYFFVLNDNDKAEDILKSVLTFATRYVDEEDYNDAFQLYKMLNETTTKNLDVNNKLRLNSELGLAKINSIIGNISQSIDLCNKKLPAFKKIFGEQSEETLTLMKILSDNYLSLGNYSDAQKIIGERLNVCRKNFGENDRRTIAVKIDLANIFYRTGKYKTADNMLYDINIPQNRELLKTDNKLLYSLLFGQYFGERMKGGNILQYDGFITTSMELEEKGFLNISDTISLELEKDKVLLSIGSVNDMVYTDLAMLNIEKLILSEHHPKLLELMNLISESHISYENLEEAEIFTNQIFELSRKNFGENNFFEWMALNTLSKIRRAEGKFTEALEIDNRALKIAEKVCGKNSLERFQTLDSIASDYSVAGNFDEAIKIREKTLAEYKKILEESDAVTIQMMTNLAEDYVAVKRYEDAVKMCTEAHALMIGNSSSQLAVFTKLMETTAKAQKFSGDYENAYKNYKNLVRAYEGERASSVKNFTSPEIKTVWFSQVLPVYKDAAVVSASDNIADTEFAFYCAEFCKGRNLIDRYEDILISGDYLLTDREKETLAEYEKLSAACQDVSEYALKTNDDILRSNVEIIRLNLKAGNYVFKYELRQKYSDNKIFKTASGQNNSEELPNIWTWEEILKKFDINKNRAVIPNGACFIEFMKVSEDELSVTLLRNEGDLQATNISVDKNFFDNCLLYHELNANAEIDDEELNELRMQIADKLSDKLIPPLEKFAADSSHWIISPDEELNLIPFETLNYKGKLLIEEKDISYVPSLAVMNLMKNRERKNSYLGRKKDLFAMGDAIYEIEDNATSHKAERNFFNKQWVNLEGTAKEIDKVSLLFESKDIFKREKASEKILKKMNASGELSGYKYLLFATHGIFVPEKPEYSAIVLSQDYNDEEDGYITVVEWMNYDLRSNLIYLSACESGLGDYQAGEGIVGIPYALTVAGNKDTVMSLWKVNDEATAEFTVAVFEKLRRGDTEVSALNKTKREFLKQNNPLYKNPSIWAAFVLYGF